MDFIRECWFILQNVPSLAHRYQSESILAAVFFVLSIAAAFISTIIKHRLTDRAPTWEKILKWVSGLSGALTVLVFVFAFVDLVKARLPFDDIVCSDIALDAYYHPPEEKTYELIERFKCANRTNSSIRNFATLRDGYFEKIPSWTLRYSLLGRPPVNLIVHVQSQPEERANNFAGGQPIFYLYRATSEFNPPLPAGTDIDLVYELAAGGAPVEAAAFSDAGTVFARGVDYDTLNYSVAIHAPPGYEIRLRGWGVLDPNGQLQSEETRRQRTPQLSTTGSLLQWQVSLARRNLSYMLRYQLKAYDLH